jgi:RNA polymerase sigma-70 factor (ECF subfamily)
VAINAARDRFRRSKREPEVVEVESIETSSALPPELPPTDLEKAINGLPGQLREAFVLGAVLGMDHNEVAGILEITPDNARARISRARVRLRELLAVKGEA